MSAPRETGDFSAPTLHTARRNPVATPGRPGGDPADPFGLRPGRGGPAPTTSTDAAGRPGSRSPGTDTAGRPGPRSPEQTDRPSETAPDAAGWGPNAVGAPATSIARGPDSITTGPESVATRTALGRQPGWVAVAILVGITAVGVLIDVLLDTSVAVNYGIVVAALVAILIVRRREMFPVLVAPPLVYVLASAAVLFLRSGGPKSTRVLYDFGANWLIYGFPSIAAATAVVLVVGAIRYVTRR